MAQSLVGGSVQVSNVTYTGASIAGGTFGGGAGIIGFDTGILLSNGDIANVIGPNTSNGISAENGTAGDPDLDQLVAPDVTHDAAVLQFDFVPQGNNVTFDYVFASDEYNEFVYSFNDVFAFYVNGQNVALVPGTNEYVGINTVNGGNPFGVNAHHPEFYRNNSRDDPGPSTINTEMDGLTTVLSVNAPVTPGVTNHIKLAIADTADFALDSNVFIRAGSFVVPPTATPTNLPGASVTSVLPTPTNTPTNTPKPATTPNPVQQADVCISLMQDPDRAVAPGGIFTYTLGVSNVGPGVASDAEASIGLDPNTEVLDFISPDKGSFVSYLSSTEVRVRFGDLGKNASASAKLIARVLPSAKAGAAINSRAVIAWDDGSVPTDRKVSNLIPMTVGATTNSGLHGLQQRLSVTPGTPSAAGTILSMQGNFFGGEEKVSFWLNLPSGKVQGISSMSQSDKQGNLNVGLDTSGLPAGNYSLVAHGLCTNVEGVGVFTIK